MTFAGRHHAAQPLVRRREALRQVLRPGDEVVAVPAIATEGVALFEAAVAQGIAGPAVSVGSPYLPGVRSRLWRYVAAGRWGVGPRRMATVDVLGRRPHRSSR